MGANKITAADANAGPINVTRSDNLAHVPEPGSAEFVALPSTDHIALVKWTLDGGWETPEIRPFGDLSISPTASCLHYATECFEGLKAYRGHDGNLRIFRPDCNGERLAKSAQRASLPVFPPRQLKYLIAKLIEIDGPRWLPRDKPGNYLYIRPAIIGTGKKLGFKIPTEALLFIVVTPYPKLSESGLKLLTSPPDCIRSWPGGFGYAKLGANYGPSLEAHSTASASGFDQILWLFGPDRLVTEAGASNLFFVWKNKETGKNEMVTPSLQSHLILSGITRRSVLELAKSRLSSTVGHLAPIEVTERDITVSEIEQAWRDGRLIEAFVTGTAYFIAPVSAIRNGDVDIEVPNPNTGVGGYGSQLKSWLEAITYGGEDHEWAYIIETDGDN